ncbi:MAG: hypothetical protein OEV94_01770 [Deltaproteobacteria bacterium]|nr:hypothetical protein [Deltaproteobacteria bacterium]
MAWDVVSPALGSRLTAAMVRQMGDNLWALAAGNSGAPPIQVGSLMVTGQASLGSLTVGNFQTSGVASVGVVFANASVVTGVSSLGALNAGSALITGPASFSSLSAGNAMVTGTASLGNLSTGNLLATGVASLAAMTVTQFSTGAVQVSLASSATPAAYTLYKNNIPKAWIHFNGTGTPAILAAFNISTISDLGVGTYIIHFATALADANYTLSGNMEAPGIVWLATVSPLKTTTQCKIFTGDTRTTTLGDYTNVSVDIHGN